ncbi:MAG: acetate kinase [Candidatus Omnitrophica bacterium]|nr:acetate kinase [Candidatus Omnitrophota bacterium]MDD5488779.1 acetate kinase [Candidatus Omnitrophota bacterium]
MLVLVINCGSSSVKFDLFDAERDFSDLCKGVVERIGDSSAELRYCCHGKEKIEERVECPDHHRAIEIIRGAITHPEKGILSDVSEVGGVGHRVVHGGEKFSDSTLVNDEVMAGIEKCCVLAPLHNPSAIQGLKSCQAIFPEVHQVAVFDTAFHHSMAEKAYTYGIPYEFYEKYGVRKYGFHGTSHRYVAGKAAEILARPITELNIITVHLGNGCSMAAVEKGKSVDTSMGLTPLEGLLMGTRSGDLDPALITFLMKKEGLDPEAMEDLLNKKSGLMGVSGVSNDMRDILGAMEKGDPRAKLAYDIFVYRIRKYIGAYAAVLGRVDAVVFTAGIGENVPAIKEELKRDLRPLLGQKTEFLTIGTNEELLIARDAYRIVVEQMKKEQPDTGAIHKILTGVKTIASTLLDKIKGGDKKCQK